MFLFGGSNHPYAQVGTAQVYLPAPNSQPIQPGQDYFLVQIAGAQAAFTGPIWDNVKGLLVTSTTNLNHPLLGDQELQALQRTYPVERNRAQQLGLAQDLISLVPASMTHVGAGISFVLDKENRLASLSTLINGNDFFSAISLAPGPLMVAKTISGLADKIISTFIPATEKQSILDFVGSFNVTGIAGGLADGYYILLGTVDPGNPLPAATASLQVQNGALMVDGAPATQFSYVILRVTRVPARPRALSGDAVWEGKLREAEDLAQTTGSDPFVEQDDKKQAWDKCKKLIQEAQALLAADPNFLRRDSEDIWKTSYKKCADALAPAGAAGLGMAKGPAAVDSPVDRVALGMAPNEDLAAVAGGLSRREAEAWACLKDAGVTALPA